MEIDKSNEIKEAMANIYTQIAEREDKSTQISNITYYKELAFDSARFIENDVFVTKLNRENGKKGVEEVYEIYNKDGDLVATVDKAGKIHFSPEYIEKLRQEYQEYFEMLNLDNSVLELPEEIKERNITLQPEELEKEIQKKKEKGKEDEEKAEEEDSDIEPIKGGLSDSMKRAAVQWGVGRVLYKMTKPLWVRIEQKGNSYVICDTERPKLNAAYLELLDKLHQLPTSPGAAQAQLSYKRDAQPPQQVQPQPTVVAPQAQPSAQQPLPFTTRQVCQYVVLAANSQQDMSGQPLVCATLQNAEGKQAKVYAQGSHPALTPGAQLYDAQITMRKQGNVAFYTLDGYQVVQQAA